VSAPNDLRACIKRAHSLWTTCYCAECVVTRRRLSKLRNAGLYRRVSSEEAWEVLAAKFDDHWTAAAVGSACGMSLDSFSRHLAEYRKGKRVYLGPVTAAQVLNMGQPTQGQIGATGTRRRLRALARMGYGLQTLSATAGVQFSTLAMVRNNNERVSAKIAAAVRETYDRLHMTPGTDRQAACQAAEKGWPPPLAWDDIDTDAHPSRYTEPNGRKGYVDHAAVERRLAGDRRVRVNHDEAAEVVRRALRAGRSTTWVEQTLGLKTERYGKGAA
jgi:hypothetical protein